MTGRIVLWLNAFCQAGTAPLRSAIEAAIDAFRREPR